MLKWVNGTLETMPTGYQLVNNAQSYLYGSKFGNMSGGYGLMIHASRIK